MNKPYDISVNIQIHDILISVIIIMMHLYSASI